MSNRVLYIEIFQPFAQYRNPFTFYYAQTYPLPPKSTIIGMLQNAVGDWYGNKYRDSWWKLKVSVHG
ncbi:MAG: CRISPR-associated protein Cas5, partial [Candidatus Aenigmatarchaeota archaeon]